MQVKLKKNYVYGRLVQVKLKKNYVYGRLVQVKLTPQEIYYIPLDTFIDNHYKCLIQTLFIFRFEIMDVCNLYLQTYDKLQISLYSNYIFFGISITIYFSDEFRTMSIDSIYLQIYNFVIAYK